MEENSDLGSATMTSKKSLKDYFVKKKSKKVRSGSRSSGDSNNSDNNFKDPLI